MYFPIFSLLSYFSYYLPPRRQWIREAAVVRPVFPFDWKFLLRSEVSTNRSFLFPLTNSVVIKNSENQFPQWFKNWIQCQRLNKRWHRFRQRCAWTSESEINSVKTDSTRSWSTLDIILNMKRMKIAESYQKISLPYLLEWAVLVLIAIKTFEIRRLLLTLINKLKDCGYPNLRYFIFA